MRIGVSRGWLGMDQGMRNLLACTSFSLLRGFLGLGLGWRVDRVWPGVKRRAAVRLGSR